MLTPLQTELLKTFARPISEQQMQEIKQLLADYFAQKVDEAYAIPPRLMRVVIDTNCFPAVACQTLYPF